MKKELTRKCSTCKYCRRYKQLSNHNWIHGYLCTLLADFSKDREFLLLNSDQGTCETYTPIE